MTSPLRHILAWIDRLSLWPLVIVGGLLAAAPFRPEPHLVEKLRMLAEGTLHRPIDIFDLVLHGAPLLVIAVKLARLALGHGRAGRA